MISNYVDYRRINHCLHCIYQLNFPRQKLQHWRLRWIATKSRAIRVLLGSLPILIFHALSSPSLPAFFIFLLSSLLRALFSVKLGGRDGSRVRIPPRNRRHRCLSSSSNVLTLNILARLSSAMDLRFGVFVVCLIAALIWQPIGGKNSGRLSLIIIITAKSDYRLLLWVLNIVVVMVIVCYCGYYEFCREC